MRSTQCTILAGCALLASLMCFHEVLARDVPEKAFVRHLLEESDTANCGNKECKVANAVAKCQGKSCAIKKCKPGFSDCDGIVENGCEVEWGFANCGGCGIVCPSRVGANPDCNKGGNCVYTCKAGYLDVDNDNANGCEVYTLTSVQYCGTTTTNLVNCASTIKNAQGISCNAGACSYASCASGYADLDGDRTNGCETSTLTSTTMCGTDSTNLVNCNTALPNANGVACQAGACTYSSCATGYASMPSTTACGVYILASMQYCGTSSAALTNCGTAVQNAVNPGCVSGACTYDSCAAGYADLDGNRANGCEVNTLTSSHSCGTSAASLTDCTVAVQNANAVSCSNGACTYSSCAAGFADLDGDRTNGCEVNIQTSTTQCGASVNILKDCNGVVQNANDVACQSGACTYSTCAAGWADLDGDRTNGCEVNTLTSTNQCGTSANALVDCSVAVLNAAGAACQAGACTYTTCASGYMNADGNASNGCEAPAGCSASVAHLVVAFAAPTSAVSGIVAAGTEVALSCRSSYTGSPTNPKARCGADGKWTNIGGMCTCPTNGMPSPATGLCTTFANVCGGSGCNGCNNWQQCMSKDQLMALAPGTMHMCNGEVSPSSGLVSSPGTCNNNNAYNTGIACEGSAQLSVMLPCPVHGAWSICYGANLKNPDLTVVASNAVWYNNVNSVAQAQDLSTQACVFTSAGGSCPSTSKTMGSSTGPKPLKCIAAPCTAGTYIQLMEASSTLCVQYAAWVAAPA
uniref:Sushi domain-containing protein n=1 Tax=Chlamydomonas chlamydogama TaxID=225041 RepID=A0A7S2VV87_9CHLO|mmetsp:Transcript_1216/g.2617  ORF Transcript_1216/g.2617 Transcript_1216/m.2617 type:complete len:749 (+) Transcript_1216:249-2495(+)